LFLLEKMFSNNHDVLRPGFFCPQCHQDMFNMETLQLHYQTVHTKPSTSVIPKVRFPFVKRILKSSPSQTSSSSIQLAPQTIGFSRIHTSYLRRLRKDRLDRIAVHTAQILFRLDQLTRKDVDIPPIGDTKERRRYEQTIVRWADDGTVSVCISCAKSFGLSRRKHHCRLDGFIICNTCSRYLSFSTARHLINANGSMTMTPAEPNEETLRICLSCQHYLQKRCDFIAFERLPKHSLIQQYDKIIHVRHEFNELYSKYSTVVDSLLTGDTIYEIRDAQEMYDQIRTCYQKIDSISQLISKLPTVDHHNNVDEVRLTTICRNIRMYAREYLQNCVLRTRRVPEDKQIEEARHQRQLEFGWKPTIDRHLLETTDEFEPFVQQHYQVIEFIRQAELAGRFDEVEVLQRNLQELEQAMLDAKKRKITT